MKERLSPETFRIPIEKVRAGYKSDVYFNRTKEVLSVDRHFPQVTMQLFQKVDGATVCGVDHALAILHAGTGYYESTAKTEMLFEKFLKLEKEAYAQWLSLGRITWEEYSKLAREVFETSQELQRLWVNTFEDLKISALFDGDKVRERETV